MKTMNIHWQGAGWYAALDVTAEPLEMVKIGEGHLSHQEAQVKAREGGFSGAVFYAAPPPYMKVKKRDITPGMPGD